MVEELISEPLLRDIMRAATSPAASLSAFEAASETLIHLIRFFDGEAEADAMAEATNNAGGVDMFALQRNVEARRAHAEAHAEEFGAKKAMMHEMLCESMPSLVGLLEPSERLPEVTITTGTLRPCGLARVLVVRLLAYMCRSGSEPVYSAMMDCDALNVAFSTFVRYPWNNAFHNAFVEFAESVAKLGADLGGPGNGANADAAGLGEQGTRLRSQILSEAFRNRLLDAYEALETQTGELGYRVGSMGHALLVASVIREAVAIDGDGGVEAGGATATRWHSFVSETLDPQILIQNRSVHRRRWGMGWSRGGGGCAGRWLRFGLRIWICVWIAHSLLWGRVARWKRSAV